MDYLHSYKSHILHDNQNGFTFLADVNNPGGKTMSCFEINAFEKKMLHCYL